MTREIALTNRHEIVSPITNEVVTESFFAVEVEDPLNVEEHMNTALAHLTRDVPMDTDLRTVARTRRYQKRANCRRPRLRARFPLYAVARQGRTNWSRSFLRRERRFHRTHTAKGQIERLWGTSDFTSS